VVGGHPPLDFDEDAAITLSGRVLRRGEAVREAFLLLTPEEGTSLLSDAKSTTTDGDGGYRIGLDRPGTYRVTVPGGGDGWMAVRSLRVEVPDEPEVRRDLVLDSGGGIAGTVHDTNGEPVRGAFVLARPEGTDGAASMRDAGHAVTAADGGYAIEGVEPGTYRVIASATGFVTGERGSLAVTEDEHVAADFRLERGAKLRGKVVDPQGNPVAGALLFAGTPGSAAPLGGPTSSDVNGDFQLTAPPAAAVDLAVMAAGWAPALVRNVTASDEPGSELRIEVSSGGRLLVRATSAEREPVAGVEVRLEPLEAQFLPFRNLAGQAPQPTAADGRVVLTLLPPGGYRVVAAGSRSFQPVEVSVQEGQEAVAELIVGD
jgi:hypothetical protein